MSKQFYFQQFSLAQLHSLVLFDLEIRLYQVLPLQVRVDLGSMGMKEYSAFAKALALLELHHYIVLCHILDTQWRGVVLLLCREAVGVFYSPSRLGKHRDRYNDENNNG